MSSLISSIRSCQENETFDLGGQSLATITHVMESAFQQPFDLVDEDMIRITFVVGAGKQARSKYDASTGKVVTQILRETCGYQEDRGASCSVECAGTYKVQHDTGKNLFTVIVFPKVNSKNNSKNGDSQPDLEEEEPLVPHDSPGYKIATCTVSVFPQMMKAKCPTWTEKKSMLQCVEALQTLVQDLETQLMHGQDLSAMENEFYNAVVELDEKHSLLKHEMQVQVMETQQLTKEEQQLLLEQCTTKLAKLQQQQNSKKSSSKTKAEITKLQQRQEVLVSLKGSTMEYPKLKHYADMSKLYNEVTKIGGLHIEETTKGRLCTVKETQILTRKQEIMEQLEYLEEASRNWFEDADMFDTRVEKTRQQLSLKYWSSLKSKSFKHTKKTNASTMASMNSKLKVNSNNNKWVTPGQKDHHNHWTSALAAKKKKRPKGGALFQAMMMDDSDDDNDDSDDDSEEDEQQQQQQHNQTQRTTTATSTRTTPKKKKASNIQKSSIQATSDGDEEMKGTATTTSSSPKKSKSKKNKKKSKKNKKNQGAGGGSLPGGDDGDEDNALNRAVEANQETQRKQEQAKEPTTNLDHVRIILVDYLLPFVGAILAWLVTLVFGTNKNKKKKKTN